MIVGDYSNYLTHMTKDHIKSGRKLYGNVIVIDGYNGAVHTSLTNNKIGIISYSSLVLHESFFAYGISTATNNIILTWMQSISNKTRKVMLLLLTPIFERQKITTSCCNNYYKRCYILLLSML